MSKLMLVAAIGALIAFPAAGAHAQTVKTPGAVNSAAPRVSGPVSRPGGKTGAHIGGAGPRTANLTAQECRKLGGKTEIDDGGSCKLRMRCTITHANGDVYSSCIDEAE